MNWNEVTRIDIRGSLIVVKDAMVMLSSDEDGPEWPSVSCEAGEYVLEIHLVRPFHADRVRLRKAGSAPVVGGEVGAVSVDHAFLGFVDYVPFLDAVKDDVDRYEEWTMTALDDELALNFSGEILFGSEKLVYVRSVDGDGVFPVFELIENGKTVGMECVLGSQA